MACTSWPSVASRPNGSGGHRSGGSDAGGAERPGDLGHRAARSRTGASEALDHRLQRAVIGVLRVLHLDLAELERAVAGRRSRDRVVVDLTQQPTSIVTNADLGPMRAHPCDLAQRCRTRPHPDEVHRLVRRLSELAGKRVLVADEGLTVARRRQLDGPAVVGPVAQAHTGSCEPEIGGVEVDRELVDLLHRPAPDAGEQLVRGRNRELRRREQLLFALSHPVFLPDRPAGGTTRQGPGSRTLEPGPLDDAATPFPPGRDQVRRCEQGTERCNMNPVISTSVHAWFTAARPHRCSLRGSAHR